MRLYNVAIPPTNALAIPVIDAVSTQPAGILGNFDLPIFPAPAPQTDPRIPVTPGIYNITLRFAVPVVNSITASLGVQPGITQAAVGQISSVALDSTNQVLDVALTGVQDVQALNLHLAGITPLSGGATGTADIPFDILQGDVTGDHVVDSADVLGVQTNFTSGVTPSTFVYDVNEDGRVDQDDIDLLQGQLNNDSLAVQTDANLALFKVPSASTENVGNLKANAFDNNPGTRWESTQGNAADPSTLSIDLGKPANIHSIVINWEDASAKTYDLQYSNDGQNWNEILNIPNNPPGGGIVNSGPLNFPAAQFIRMNGTVRNTGYGYSILEFQVFGSYPLASSGTTPPPTAPSITSALAETVAVNTPFNYQIQATQNPTIFSASSLPQGLTINASGLISGTPQTAGITDITITASNGSATGTAVLVLTVNAPPAAPTNLAAVATTTPGQIALSWQPSNNATSYSVFRGIAPGAEGTPAVATNLNGTSFVDSGLAAGTAYFYKVAAVNTAGTSGPSNEASATPTGIAIPVVPSNLTAISEDSQVALSWIASTGAATYNVYRSTSAGGEGTTPFTTGVNGTTFVDSQAINGTTYFYKVAAVNSAAQVSGFSNEASATPQQQQQQSGVAIYQINAGGASVPPFTPDAFFDNPGQSSTGNIVSSQAWRMRHRWRSIRPITTAANSHTPSPH